MIEKALLFYMKKLRDDHEQSLDFLANKIGVSASYLHDIERGRRNFSYAIFDKVIEFYNVKFIDTKEIYHEVKCIALEMLDALLIKDLDGFNRLFKSFQNEKIRYLESSAYIFIDLIESMKYALKDSEKCKIYLDKCRDYFWLYDNEMVFAYAILYIFTMQSVEDYPKIKKILEYCVKSYSTHNLHPPLKGMLYFQIGKVKEFEKNHIDAIRMFDKSISYFQECYCLERVIEVKIQTANNAVLMNMFDFARKSYIDLLEISEQKGYKRRQIACLNNLAYVYVITGECERCIDIVNKALILESKHEYLYFYLAYSLYKLNELKKAKHLIVSYEKFSNDKHVLNAIRVIKGIINNNESMVDYSGRKYLEFLYNVHEVHEYKMVLKLLAEYYKGLSETKYEECVSRCLELNV